MRGASEVDLVTDGPDHGPQPLLEEVVDVLVADHHAPRVTERLAGRDMVRIEGGTQALRRTINAHLVINAHLEIEAGTITTISVPRPFGALILKAAAYLADSRNRDRHLHDAVALLACIEDPFAERDSFTGSDRSRLQNLRNRLARDDISRTALSGQPRIDAAAALKILTDQG